ncbi:MAG: alpha/beta hydrolase fold domain-containing protein [Culicoidibacterales bacterium]
MPTINKQKPLGNQGGFGKQPLDSSFVTKKQLQIAYATLSPTQTLDLYYPTTGTAPFPVIIEIHGGAFMKGRASSGQMQSILEAVKHGFVVASINYRLSGEAIFPAAVNDVQAATRFLRANAEKFELDETRFIAWGGSAGGNLAAMLGILGAKTLPTNDVFTYREIVSTVSGVIDWFGPLDFLQMDAQFAELGIQPKFGPTNGDDSPESRYLGQNITLDPTLTQQANPLSYLAALPAEQTPKFLIQHGTLDRFVPFTQSQLLYDALCDKVGAEQATFIPLVGAGHGTSEFDEPTNLAHVFNWLKQNFHD